MSTARKGQIFGVILPVPGEAINIKSILQSWTKTASRETLLTNLAPFSGWVGVILARTHGNAAVWQPRDIGQPTPLVIGRTSLVCDTVQALLPAQD